MIESIQEIVSKMNKAERELFVIFSETTGGTERDLQVTRCDGTSGTGFHLQIPGRTTTWPINLGIADRDPGGLKATPMRNGNILAQVRSCGLMESVSILSPCFFPKLMITFSIAGAGKSVIWCDNLQLVPISKLM